MENKESGDIRTTSQKVKICTFAVLALAVACVAMRLLAAWLLRNENNGDLAIVQLMVRDIVTGNGIPVFFYGQAYMGTLEPLTNALTHVICGFTNFGTELGTALYTLLAVFFAARLAKRGGGMPAAAVALLFCVCGPMPFFHYAVSPRGGYGVLFFVSAGVLDLASDMVCRERNSKSYSRWLPFLFGLFTGIGFWNNQLCAPAVIAGVVCILICAPRLLTKASLWIGGVLGFVVGSLPFWLWNMANKWESFGLSGSLALDPVVAVRNTVIFFCVRWLQFLGIDPHVVVPTSVSYVVIAASAVPFVVLTVVYLTRICGRFVSSGKKSGIIQPVNMSTDASVVTLVSALYFVAFITCFVFSHFAVFSTPRYLLPLVPVMGVVCGLAFTVSNKKIIRILVAAAVIIMVCWQFYEVKFFFAMSDKHNGMQARNENVVAYLKEHNVDSAYCSFLMNSLNLSGDGSVVFSDKNLERVPAFRRKLESSDSPAVIENFFGIETWARATGGTFNSAEIDGVRVTSDLVPPKWPVRELSSDTWLSVVDSAGRDVTDLLANRSEGNYVRLNSNMAGVPGRETYSETFTLAFKKPEMLAGIRLFASEFNFAGNITFYGRKSGNSEYFRLTAPLIRDPMCIWSGPRFYPTKHCERREVRFEPVEVDSVKVEISGGAYMANAVAYELQTLAPLEDSAPRYAFTKEEWDAGVDGLMSILASNSISRLYATRWVSNRVFELSKGAIWTDHGDDLTPKMTGLPAVPQSHDLVSLDARSAVLLSESGCPSMRDVAKERNLTFREVPVPLLGTLFIPDSVQKVPFGEDEPLGIELYDDFAVLVPSGEWIANLLNDTPRPHSADWLRQLYAENPLLIPLLEEISSNPAMSDIAAEVSEKVKLISVPEYGGDAMFDDILNWRGCRILSRPEHVTRGSTIVIRHYWSSPCVPDSRSKQKFAMVHFYGQGGFRFQDDYDIGATAENFDTFMEKTGACTWHTDRVVCIPDNAPLGEFELRVGVYDKNFLSHRLHVKTDLPVSRNAVRIFKFFVVE